MTSNKECNCTKPCKAGCKKRKSSATGALSREVLFSKEKLEKKDDPCSCALPVCDIQCEDKPCMKGAEPVVVPSATKPGPSGVPCESPCECTGPECNDACEEQKLLEAEQNKKPSVVCEICACADPPCNEACELKKRQDKEMEDFLNQIKCACMQAQMQLCGPSIIKDKELKATISTLEMALESLQDKCKTKDLLIDAMKEELKKTANNNIFDEMLDKIAHNKDKIIDFDKHLVAIQSPQSRNISVKECSCEGATTKDPKCDCIIAPRPLEIVDLRLVTPSSVLVKWRAAEDSHVIGYEIAVEGVTTCRVFNRERDSTIIESIDVKPITKFAIYAVTNTGRCYPAATAVLKS